MTSTIVVDQKWQRKIDYLEYKGMVKITRQDGKVEYVFK